MRLVSLYARELMYSASVILRLFHPDNINGCQLRDGRDTRDHILRDQQAQHGPEKDGVFPHWQSKT